MTACVALAWGDGSAVRARPGGAVAGTAPVFLACAAAALVVYAAGLAALRRGGRLGLVVAVAVAVQTVTVAAPLLLSTDAWAYWAYGRIAAVGGESPYATAPAAFPDDPASRFVGADWRDAESVYGPAFTLASEPVALAAGESADAAAWIFKALAAAAVIAATLLAARLARRPALAAAFVGWNPVLALHFGGGGHNDAWVGALVLAALALGASERRQAAGVAWASAVLVKWVPVLFLLLRVVEARAARRRAGHLGFALAATAVAAVATWRYGPAWFEALGPLARTAARQTAYAIPSRLEGLGAPEWLAVGLPAAGFVVAYAWLVREAVRGRARLALCACLLLLAVPYLAPWYLAWAVPLAAAEEDRAARLLALGLSAYLLPQTIPL